MCECLKLGRLSQVGSPVKTPEGTEIVTMFCDACGGTIDLVAENFDEKNLDGKKLHVCQICGCQLYAAGMSRGEIAKRLGISIATVYRVI